MIAVTAIMGFSVLSAVPVASKHKADPTCSISPNPAAVGQTYVVSAGGLPALSAINLFVTDASGTTGSPLGSTPDGSFALNESSALAGTTTYKFTGPVRNNNMQVYATCSVNVHS